MTKEIKSPNKSLIFLKASTIAMGLIFVVLLIALILIKQKKSHQKINNCADFLQLKIVGEVDKMEFQGSNIIILTKPNFKTKKQEIF